MSTYSQRLQTHLKNRAQRIKKTTSLSHSDALDKAAMEFGFSAWKQSTTHMTWADDHIDNVLSALPSEVLALSGKFRSQTGYPHLFDDRTGINYDPVSKTQCRDLAQRLVMLELFDAVNAPTTYRGQSVASMRWFKRVLDFDDAVEQSQQGAWKVRAHGVTGTTSDSQPDPELIFHDLLDYVHGRYSLSVLRALAGEPQTVLDHPCFKEFFRHSVAAWVQTTPQLLNEVLLTLITAHVGDLPKESQIDTSCFLWRDVIGIESRLSGGVSMILGLANQPRLQRPPNPLGQHEHEQIARRLSRLQELSSKRKELNSDLNRIHDVLGAWAAKELGNRDTAERIYHSQPMGSQSSPFLAPAQKAEFQTLLENIRNMIQQGYEHCIPKTTLLARFDKVESKFASWMNATDLHWQRENQKLVMNSPGLIAVNNSNELSLEDDSVWKPIQILGTPYEAQLIEVLRPHLFECWRVEDLAENLVFDPTDPGSEESILNHLSDLSFYRYVGPANIRQTFAAEVRKACFFPPEHVWFKRHMIDVYRPRQSRTKRNESDGNAPVGGPPLRSPQPDSH